jgi:hypothetical protein
MAGLEEDQYMDLAAAGANDPESAAPMVARSRCLRSTAGMRRRWHSRCFRNRNKVWVGLSLTAAERHCRFAGIRNVPWPVTTA